MNTLNSRTNASNRFIYQFNDKLNLKNPNKNIALANLSIYYIGEISNLSTIIINLKYMHQLGMMDLICPMDLTTLNRFNIISNT